ncbi:MAG TPA: hypothetical protein VJJ21_02315 [Candidatus Nanoarchaeia archaeon]|nr:hypothetical protein [Candidatus Nanoarchaeia archaeon]
MTNTLRNFIITLFIISIAVFLTAIIIQVFHPAQIEKPVNTAISKVYSVKLTPPDRIKESQIHVYEDKIIIDIKNPKWARFANTNSMVPFLDEGTNAIQIQPGNPEDIQLGDIISYEYGDSIIIHRVVEINEDSEGKYYIVKGDNNPQEDPIRVRFPQIKRILVGVIY